MRLTVEFVGPPDSALFVQDEVHELLDQPTVTVDPTSSRQDSVTGAEVALVIFLIYVAPVTAAHVVDVVYKIRQRFRPLTVLDLTSDEPKMTVIEDAPGHAGELVIKTREGETVTFIDGPEIPRSEVLEFVQRYLPS